MGQIGGSHKVLSGGDNVESGVTKIDLRHVNGSTVVAVEGVDQRQTDHEIETDSDTMDCQEFRNVTHKRKKLNKIRKSAQQSDYESTSSDIENKQSSKSLKNDKKNYAGRSVTESTPPATPNTVEFPSFNHNKVLYMTGVDFNITQVNPIKIRTLLDQCIPDQLDDNKVTGGQTFRMVCKNVQQYNTIKKMKTLGPYKIVVTPPRGKTIIKPWKYGTISGVDTTLEPKQVFDLLDIKPKKVIRVTRGGQDTKIIKLAYEETVPCIVRIGAIHHKVRLADPTPLRCFNCQDFFHNSNQCRNDPRCNHCGGGAWNQCM